MMSVRQQQDERNRIILSRFTKRMMYSRLLSFFASWSEFSVKSVRDRMIVQRFLNRYNSMRMTKTFRAWEEFVSERIQRRTLEQEKKAFEKNIKLHHEASMQVAETNHKQQLKAIGETHEQKLEAEKMRMENEQKSLEDDMADHIAKLKKHHVASKLAHKIASESAVRARLKLMKRQNEQITLSFRQETEERNRIIVSRFVKRMQHSTLLFSFAAWSENVVKNKRDRLIIKR